MHEPDSMIGGPAERDFTALAAYRGIRVLVYGATGFIGQWVTRLLLEIGAETHVVARDLVRGEALLAPSAAEGAVHVCDLSNVPEAAALLHSVRPAISFNLSGYGVRRSERDEGRAMRINVDLVESLVRAAGTIQRAEWRGQELVHVGSALEYGAQSGDLSEDTIPRPTTLYGRSKLAGTLAVQRASAETGVRALTARLFSVYGPGEGAGRLLPSIVAAHRSGVPLDLTDGLQQRDFTYVEDVAEGLLRLGLASASRGEVVNLASGRLTSVRAFAETAAEVLGMQRELLRFGVLPTRAEEMAHAPVAIERLRAHTRWTPETSVREGIIRSVAG